MEERSDVEKRVLQAARKLFVAQGVAKTPLRVVATAAGTSESGILRFFRDKDDLARAVMDLCWVDINGAAAEARRAGAERGDDPRFVLVQAVRAVLEHAAADKKTMSFLVSHFHYTLSGGSDDGLAAGGQSRLDAYREYRRNIDELCARVSACDPGLGEAGISQQGLCHLTLSLIYGITGGWYLSEQDPVVHGAAVPLEDALGILRRVVYPNGS